MKYDHAVKYNGKWYEPFEEILETEEPKEEYTKSDITTMRVDDLRNLAASMGVQGATDMTGTELKQILITMLGL